MPKDLLKRLILLKRNPQLANVIPQAELLEMMVTVVEAFNRLETAIKDGRLKGAKGDPGEPGATPEPLKPGVDYPTYSDFDQALAKYQKEYDALQAQITARLAEIKSGKDAEVTPEMIEQAAELAYGMIELPNFADLIQQEREAIRNSLETFFDEDDKLSQDAIRNLPRDLQEIRNAIASTPKGTGGGLGPIQVNKLIAQASISDLLDVKKLATAPASPKLNDLWIDIS